MNIKMVKTAAFFVAALFLSDKSVFAESVSHATHTMVGILLHLNHYPTAPEKESLKGLINDKSTTEHEKVLATALVNLNHTASASDKEKLQTVVNDKSSKAYERDVANIIININHVVSEGDKKVLSNMVK